MRAKILKLSKLSWSSNDQKIWVCIFYQDFCKICIAISFCNFFSNCNKIFSCLFNSFFFCKYSETRTYTEFFISVFFCEIFSRYIFSTSYFSDEYDRFFHRVLYFVAPFSLSKEKGFRIEIDTLPTKSSLCIFSSRSSGKGITIHTTAIILTKYIMLVGIIYTSLKSAIFTKGDLQKF